jgi:hypothetical protein
MTELPDGLWYVDVKGEGAPTPWPPGPPAPKRPWLVRTTEWPRRKIARFLERLANRICRDRDEGW